MVHGQLEEVINITFRDADQGHPQDIFGENAITHALADIFAVFLTLREIKTLTFSSS